jgi:E3 ubiquitin-protein ligase SHPRH
MKAEAVSLRQARAQALSPEVTATLKGKGKEREIFSEDESDGDEDHSSEHDREDDLEETDLPKIPAGEEHRTKRRAIKQ